MSTTLSDFLSALDAFTPPVDIGDLTARLEDLDIDLDQIREYVRFSPQRYQRNLLHTGPHYHALVLCWQNGQRSPIHDHRGSACGVRVLSGVATETIFKHGANGLIYPTSTSELRTGGVTGSYDSDIHQVSNLQPGDAGLVTLHVYSPPLVTMGTYSLTDPTRKEFTDPIFEFAAGAGI